MKNRQNLIPIIGIALLALVFVSNALAPRPAVTAPPAVTENVRPATIGDLEKQLVRLLEENMTGHYRLTVDEQARTVTTDIFNAGLNVDAINGALSDLSLNRKYYENVEALRHYSETAQRTLDLSGFDDYTAVVRLVNCDDLDHVFAELRRGEVVYDIVAATPAGERVEDPVGRAVSGETRYIVNTGSMKFHLPDCEYAQEISGDRRAVYTGDRAELIAMGYDPCNWCRP